MSFLLHDPMWRPLGAAGEILPGCYAQWYESDTTTPTPVYADAGLTTPLTNPVVADSAGRLPAIYGHSAVVYRRQLYDADDTLLLDTDPIHPTAEHPAGTIVMFRGDATARDAAYPPALWEVCDGDNGTIDFTGRSPVGAGTGYAVGDTGGSIGDGTTGSGGAHDHGEVTGSHTLTTSEIPSHSHFCAANVVGSVDVAVTASLSMDKETTAGGDTEYKLRSSSVAPTVSPTSTAGSGSGHTHSIEAATGHTHSFALTQSPWGAVWMLERKA